MVLRFAEHQRLRLQVRHAYCVKLLQAASSRSLFFGAESSSDSYSLSPNGIACPTNSLVVSREDVAAGREGAGHHAHGLVLDKGTPWQHGQGAGQREQTGSDHRAHLHAIDKARDGEQTARHLPTHPSSAQASASVSTPSGAVFFASGAATPPSSRTVNPSADTKCPSASTNL